MPPATEPTEQQAIVIPGSYADRLMEARWHQEHGEWEEAGAIYQRLVDRLARLPERRRAEGSELHEYLVAAAAGLAATRSYLGDLEATDRICAQLEGWDPTKAGGWRRYAFLLRIEFGQVEAGLLGLLRLAEDEPDNADTWLVLADSANTTRHFDLADQAIDRAAALAAGSDDDDLRVEVHLARFTLYRLQRRWKEAGAEWDAAVALNPDVEEMQETVVRMFLEAELWDDAQRAVQDAFEEPLTMFYEGYIAYRRGDKVRARALWRKVVQAETEEDGRQPYAQAMAWCYLGAPGEALRLLLEEVSSDRQVNVRSATILALAWAMQGNLEAALANLGAAKKSLHSVADDKLPWLDWYDFDELVRDDALKAALRPFFEKDG